MASKFYQQFSNFLKRDLIKKGEGKLTYVQIFGFILITLGVIYFASFLLPSGIIDLLPFLKLAEHPESSEVPIAFFTIMLGVAFAFPDMLKGQTKEISTMRIIVFMFANVICMLLLKIGWDKQSLTEIGLDGFWMGLIAFLFGAKATQAYFENADKLIPKKKNDHINEANNQSNDDMAFNKFQIAELASELAVAQNCHNLHAIYENIQTITHNKSEDGSYKVSIFLNDNHIEDIPSELKANFPNGTELMVPTKIIAHSGPAIPHYGQATDEISDSKHKNEVASFCCIAYSLINSGFKGIVTAGHNFTEGEFDSFNGYQLGNDKRDVYINNEIKGKLYYQRMSLFEDLAIVEVTDKLELTNNYISFSDYYELTDKDLRTDMPNISIASRKNDKRIGSNVRNAFVLYRNVPYDIKYNAQTIRMQNVILIGSANNDSDVKEVSLEGDSGSCVYISINGTNKLIGILVGGNGKFSFVLPIKLILDKKQLKIN